MKTREEVEDLKKQWEIDPCWDIWTTEGFEDYENELFEFYLEKKKEWNWGNVDEQKDGASFNYKDFIILWVQRILLTSFLAYVLWAGFYIKVGIFEFMTFGLKYHVEKNRKQ